MKGSIVKKTTKTNLGICNSLGHAVTAFMLVVAMGGLSLPVRGQQIYVSSSNGNTIGEYNPNGSAVNPSLITGLSDPQVMAVGGNLFVVNQTTGTIGEYTTSGALVSASLITGLSSPTSLVISGTNLFVANNPAGVIGEYTTSGGTVTPR